VSDQSDFEKREQRYRAKAAAETARLKALWDVENAVDTGARRAAAAKAAEEQRIRETPSDEDKERAKRIFAGARWEPTRHRVLGDKHIFDYTRPHPLRKYANYLHISFTVEQFRNEAWCREYLAATFAEQWHELLLNETGLAEEAALYHRAKLAEITSAAERFATKPNKIDFSLYEGFKHIAVGQVLTGLIVARVVSIDDTTGSLRLLVLDPRQETKHVVANEEFTFVLHEGETGKHNLWSLRDEEHECWDGEGHDADLLLYYFHDSGAWSFDLDS
jgi:hypothetical protein